MPRSGGLYYTSNVEPGAGLPALILIHGAGGSGGLWPYHLRRLPGWQVLAPDLPGHGGSSLPTERSIAGYAARLWDWVDSLKLEQLEQVALCGHSMGAAIAMQMALAAPERARGLVLIGAAAKFVVNDQLLQKLNIPVRTQEGINLIARWSFAPQAEDSMRRAYTRQLLSCPQGLLYSDFKLCADFDLGERSAQLGRALVLCGEVDAMVSPRLSEALAEAMPRAKLGIILGAGHMMMLEKPAETAAAIEKALAEWTQA